VQKNSKHDLIRCLNQIDTHTQSTKGVNMNKIIRNLLKPIICGGGANTNKNGLSFEKNTCNVNRLLFKGFEKSKIGKGSNDFYLKKTYDNKDILYVTKGGLKTFIKQNFNGKVRREPDEAYIINNNGVYELKIIEKKFQSAEGSVDVKLGAAGFFIYQYQQSLSQFLNISYAFCVNDFFRDKKYDDVRKYNKEHLNVEMFYGEDPLYFDTLDKWIGISAK
jgi:hypothetical protein